MHGGLHSASNRDSSPAWDGTSHHRDARELDVEAIHKVGEKSALDRNSKRAIKPYLDDDLLALDVTVLEYAR